MRQPEEGNDVWLSGCWGITADDAHQLSGGWIYLHPEGKKEKSEYGGKVLSVRECDREGKAKEKGYAILFQFLPSAKGQSWRGRDDVNAHSGGLVDCTFSHETA